MLDCKYKQRFSQLLIEDSEIYTHKFLVQLGEDRQGFLHVSSKSVVLEEFAKDSPLKQYFYRDMCNIPRQDPDSLDSIIFSICSYKILPDIYNSISIESKTEAIHEISFKPLYESPSKVVEAILVFYIKGKNNNWVVSPKEVVENMKMKNKFDYAQIESIKEVYLIREAVFAYKVKPLISSPGWLMITDKRIYFQHILPVDETQLLQVAFESIESVYKRKLIFQNNSIEVFAKDQAFLFKFLTEKIRDLAFTAIFNRIGELGENEIKLDEMMTKWQQRQISNFEYLLFLNLMANRTFNDLSQYPVFPWVLNDYVSDSIDLNDPKVYRDLSKPVGGLNPKKLAYLKSQSFDESKFMYMSCYSNPSIVTRWLIRSSPILTLNQSRGSLPHPSKIFHSLGEDWLSCLSNPLDFRELIPEFYSSDETFLLNSKQLSLGVRPDRASLSHVCLPKWASSPSHLLATMRKALESEHVSQNLHLWIDLIFGKNQRGEAAIESSNGKLYAVFHPIAYEGFFDFDSTMNVEAKEKNEKMVQEYGQVPKQLFKFGHPPRSELPSIVDVQKGQRVCWDVDLILKKPGGTITELHSHNKRVSSIHKLDTKVLSTGYDGQISIGDQKRIQLDRPIQTSALRHSSYIHCALSEHLSSVSLQQGQVVQDFKAHEDKITSIQVMEPHLVLSCSWDQTIKIWDSRSRNRPVFSYSNDREFTCMSINCNETYKIITGDMNGCLGLYDIRLGLVSSVKCSDFIFAVKSTAYGDLVCGSLAAQIYRDGKLNASFNVPGVQCVDSDGKFAFFGKEEENLTLWEVINENFLYVWDEVCDVSAVLVDGNEVFAGSIQGRVAKID